MRTFENEPAVCGDCAVVSGNDAELGMELEWWPRSSQS
jgi:hypothetical protein